MCLSLSTAKRQPVFLALPDCFAWLQQKKNILFICKLCAALGSLEYLNNWQFLIAKKSNYPLFSFKFMLTFIKMYLTSFFSIKDIQMQRVKAGKRKLILIQYKAQFKGIYSVLCFKNHSMMCLYVFLNSMYNCEHYVFSL